MYSLRDVCRWDCGVLGHVLRKITQTTLRAKPHARTFCVTLRAEQMARACCIHFAVFASSLKVKHYFSVTLLSNSLTERAIWDFQHFHKTKASTLIIHWRTHIIFILFIFNTHPHTTTTSTTTTKTTSIQWRLENNWLSRWDACPKPIWRIICGAQFHVWRTIFSPSHLHRQIQEVWVLWTRTNSKSGRAKTFRIMILGRISISWFIDSQKRMWSCISQITTHHG